MVNGNIVTMTIWTPDLAGRPGPTYKAIADALGEAIAAGTLPPDARLPTHRDLAWRLGVTVTTITRAYREARARGLVSGTVGRGTFVRPPEPAVFSEESYAIAPLDESGPIDLSLNFPVLEGRAVLLAETLAEMSRSNSLDRLLRYQPDVGLPEHRAAGAAWMAESGVAVSADSVVVTAGAQHAIGATLAALCKPGDAILTESLTFPGVKALAQEMRLTAHGVAMDAEGLRPDALEEACRTHAPRALYLVPTLQNPTSTIMPEARRRRIAAVCERHGVTIIEDDIYALLLSDRPPPMATFLPRQTVYIASAAKALAPGLRVGFCAAPPALLSRIGSAVRLSCWMAPPLTVEVVRRWMDSGQATRIVADTRAVIAQRRALADRLLLADTPGLSTATPAESYHLWLRLPEGWTTGALVDQAHGVGLTLQRSDVFAVGRDANGQTRDHLRLCLGTEGSEARFAEGLRRLRDLLRQPAGGVPAVV